MLDEVMLYIGRRNVIHSQAVVSAAFANNEGNVEEQKRYLQQEEKQPFDHDHITLWQ